MALEEMVGEWLVAERQPRAAGVEPEKVGKRQKEE